MVVTQSRFLLRIMMNLGVLCFCGLQSMGCFGECRSHQRTACVSGTVYWLDSCGNTEEATETCGCACSENGEGCMPCDCNPNCLGKECGPNGCGGQCAPGCGADETCSAEGLCLSCAPDCTGHSCGPDSCGRQCGPGCADGESCTNEGKCEKTACGLDTPVEIQGKVDTNVATLEFDSVTVVLSHKRDVDAWEDGCITNVKIDLAKGGGCLLHLAAGGRLGKGGGLEIQELQFVADSACPGFPDADEGTYVGVNRLEAAEVVPNISKIPGNNLLQSCTPVSFTLLIKGELLRVTDGRPLDVEFGQMGISGEFVSVGDPSVSCPCAPQCDGKDCGPDGCGGTCGDCHGSARCSTDGRCLVAGADTCWEGDNLRTKISLQLGDLVITEVMPDSGAVVDAAGEWFEVKVRRAVDLNGLRFGQDADTTELAVAEGDCLRVESGDFLLMAHSADPATNGGLPDADLLFSFALGNTQGSLYLGCAGQLIDAVSWNESTPGVAQNLDPSGEDPWLNDQTFFWCAARQPFGLGDLGTPKMANASCDLPLTVCTENGATRPKILPVPGDLVITEIMADPTLVSDADGEWFEIAVLRDLDINGLRAGRELPSQEMVAEGECVRVTAGTRLLFAKKADPGQNGGLPVATGLFSFSLINAGGSLSVGIPSLTLDQVQYPAQLSGVAWSLDPDSTNVEANDLVNNWCYATQAYNSGSDLGTPGADNPECMPAK